MKTEKFLLKLKSEQPNIFSLYQWSEFIYKTRKEKSIVIDDLGRKSLISPDSLLAGMKATIDSAIDKTEYAISTAMNRHGNYSYNNFEYISAHHKTFVTCQIHGDWETTYNEHVNKNRGCSNCGKQLQTGNYSGIYKYEPDKEVYLYHMKLSYGGEEFYKIGLSKNPNYRSTQFKPYNAEVIESKFGKVKDLYPLEQELKQLFLNYGINYTPVYDFAGKHECYLW